MENDYNRINAHTNTQQQQANKRWINGKSSFSVLCHRCGYFYICLHFGYFDSSIHGYYSFSVAYILIRFVSFDRKWNEKKMKWKKIDLNSGDYLLAQDIVSNFKENKKKEMTKININNNSNSEDPWIIQVIRYTVMMR